MGTLTGVVKDPNGANLPGVSVVVKNLATGAVRTAVTGKDGHWTMPTLPIEFGWDVFNVFNRANFAAPDFELGSPDFGRITSTVGGPRVMQFRAKFKF